MISGLNNELLARLGADTAGVSNTPAWQITEEYLSGMLARSMKADKASVTAHELLMRYGSLDAIFSESHYKLEQMLGESAATLIKLLAYTSSRRRTDLFRFGKKHSLEEIKELLIATFIGLSVETVYMVSIDEEGRTVACDFVGEGTVNASDMYPRKIAEYALRRGASSVIIAHNHPTGVAEASQDDIATTARLFSLLRSSSITLEAHIIVAAHRCRVLTIGKESGNVAQID